jgi:hypothetical protein
MLLNTRNHKRNSIHPDPIWAAYWSLTKLIEKCEFLWCCHWVCALFAGPATLGNFAISVPYHSQVLLLWDCNQQINCICKTVFQTETSLPCCFLHCSENFHITDLFLILNTHSNISGNLGNTAENLFPNVVSLLSTHSSENCHVIQNEHT